MKFPGFQNPIPTPKNHDPDEYQWQLLLADQKIRQEEEDAANSAFKPLDNAENQQQQQQSPS